LEKTFSGFENLITLTLSGILRHVEAELNFSGGNPACSRRFELY
jgi:hypothetical protein